MVDVIIRIKHFGLVFGSITDGDYDRKVTGAGIIDRDNQGRFILKSQKSPLLCQPIQFCR
jgi:hypothetical protein